LYSEHVKSSSTQQEGKGARGVAWWSSTCLQCSRPRVPSSHTHAHTQVCASTHRGKTDDPILKWANWMLWLTPVILATQEEEIRRISVQSQP
jgi:hypothetical protein